MVIKILVEGLDYSGKSTLCRTLKEELSNKGKRVLFNKGDIIKTNLTAHTKKELYADDSDLIKLNSLLTLGPFFDALNENNQTGIDYLIQESYIDRTIGYNKANNIPFFADMLESVYHKLVQFDISFFLEADIEERKARFKKRVQERNKYDSLIFEDPTKFLEINRLVKNSFVKRKNSYVLDTTSISTNEVYEKVISKVEEIAKWQKK